MHSEIVIIGGGIMGTAASLELVRRGHKVVLVERFDRGHSRGSSHGPTRIFRFSYPEPDYVRFVAQALEDWHRLERDSGKRLLEVSGGIDLGSGAFDCADAMASVGIDVLELSGSEVKAKFPLDLPDSSRAIFQPDAAVIAAEMTVSTQVELAIRGGAEIRFGEAAIAVDIDGAEVAVTTEGGKILADTVVLAGGAWMRPLAASIGIDLPLRVTREQVAYFTPCPADMPVVIDWDHPIHYLVPQAFGASGMRVGLHHDGAEVDPDDGPFQPDGQGVADVASWIEDLTGIVPRTEKLESCLYTNAPSDDFIMKRSGSVVILSACSGHGFKFGPRIGRVAADLVEGKDPGLPDRLAAANL